MAQVLVIGAGVIGLQTAVTLLEVGYKVTILAKHFPRDESIEYTSPWAGAIWRTHSTPDQVERCQWDAESYRVWLEISEKEPEKAERMGIMKTPITIYSNDTEVDITSPYLWYTSHVRDFSILPPSALPPGVRSGHTFISIALDPTQYLKYLLNHAKSLGARTITTELPTSQSFVHVLGAAISHIYDPKNDQIAGIENRVIVVNCAGLGAKTLCGDGAMYPIRGQTLLVRIDPPPAQEILLEDDPKYVTYIIPRPGTNNFVLGGTKDADDWRNTPDSDISKGIIERASKLLSKNGGTRRIEVLASQVGLRPGRKGGARVEIEKVEIGKSKFMNVVHHYGHAGAGYQNSIGSAKKVLRLVREALG